MDPITFGIVIALAGVPIAGSLVYALVQAARAQKRVRARRHAVWAEVAARREAKLHDADWSRVLGPTGLSMDVEGPEVPVHLEVVSPASNDPQLAVTRARAPFWGPGAPVFGVTPAGMFSKVARRKDVELGEERDFDDNFLVDTDEPERTRSVLSVEARRTLVRRFLGARLASDGVTVEIVVGAFIDELVDLEALLDLAHGIAVADIYGLAALKALPGAVYHPRRPGVPPHVTVGDVALGPASGGAGVVTRAQAPARRDPASVVIGDELPRELAVLAPVERWATLRGSIVSVAGDSATLTWPGVESDPERLRAGIRLVELLAAGPSSGPFR
jgi:hypothetical protein